MKGIIHKINERRGMIAIRTEDNNYSVFEFLGGLSGEFELDDVVKWNDDTSLGDTIVKNLTQGTNVEVYFQKHEIGQSNLGQQLLL